MSYRMQNISLERFVNVIHRSEKIFKILAPKLYKRYKYVLKNLHNFTENIIEERRKEMLQTNEDKNPKSALEVKANSNGLSK